MSLKKFKIVLLLSMIFLLTGCREYGEKRIVKLITIDEEKISLYYYDYSEEEPSYIVKEKENNGIENTVTELLSEADYDLKLCKYAVCNEYIVENEAEKVFFALTNAKFSPDIAVLEGDTGAGAEKYITMENTGYPVYNFQIKDDKITGIIENADNGKKNIIMESEFYKELDEKHSILADILSGSIKRCIYVFENENKMLSANLENISLHGYVENECLNINITAWLKSYKGMSADKEEKKKIAELLRNDMKNNIQEILEDKQIVKVLNVLWYEKLYSFDEIKTEVDIN